jgi:transcriptional regulator with XRE-family HTH domain
MQTDKEKRSEKLRNLRKKSGLTQNDIAEALGVTISAIQKYEYGKTEPTASGWLTLARLYGVNVAELLDPEATPEPPEPIPPGCVLVPIPIEILKKLNI